MAPDELQKPPLTGWADLLDVAGTAHVDLYDRIDLIHLASSSRISISTLRWNGCAQRSSWGPVGHPTDRPMMPQYP
jgi:hypothetical protein